MAGYPANRNWNRISGTSLHISRPPTLGAKNCPKFFNLYVGIYGFYNREVLHSEDNILIRHLLECERFFARIILSNN